jgi:hypothetical protein
MVFRTHSRLVQVSTIVIVLAATGCVGGGPSRTMRNGEDMLILGGTPFVRALDSVPGDAILMGGDIRFEGSAGGDYLGAGGKQRIAGHVHGSARSVGGEIHVVGAVDRNATIAGGNVSLDSSAVVGGNAYVTGGSVSVLGAVRGSLMASGGEVSINGPVGRDVEVSAGALHLGPRAQISGNLQYRVAKDKVTIDPGAHVAGSTTALAVKSGPGTRGLLWTLGLVVAGIVIVALFPVFTTEAAETLYQRPGRAAATGFVWVCLLPIAAAIAAVTIIGIPLAILAIATWVAVIFLADIPVALWIGKKLLGSRAHPGRNGAILSVLVGGLILTVVGLVPVLGLIATFIAGVLGAGAIVIRARRSATAQADYAI